MNDSTCSRLAFTVGSSDLKGSDFNAKGVYNEHGESCSTGGMSVETRICRQCLNREPAVPPGEIVKPGSPAGD